MAVLWPTLAAVEARVRGLLPRAARGKCRTYQAQLVGGYEHLDETAVAFSSVWVDFEFRWDRRAKAWTRHAPSEASYRKIIEEGARGRFGRGFEFRDDALCSVLAEAGGGV